MKKRAVKYGLAMAAFTSLVFLLTMALRSQNQVLEEAKNQVLAQGRLVEEVSLREEPGPYLDLLEEGGGKEKLALLDQEGDCLYSSLDMDNLSSYIETRPPSSGPDQGPDFQSLDYGLRTRDYLAWLDLDSGWTLISQVQTTTILAQALGFLPMTLAIFFVSSFLNAGLIQVLWDRSQKNHNFILRNITSLVEDQDLVLPLEEDYQESLAIASSEAGRIFAHIQDLDSQLVALNDMIVNMREGVVLVGSDRKIMTINQAAVKLLDASIHINYRDKDILYLSRDLDFIKTFNQAFSGPSAGVESISLGERVVKTYLNPVFTADGTFFGMMLLLIDSTEASRAEKLRQEFSSNITHELKTPLTSIRGYAELLKTGLVSEEDHDKFLDIILEESVRLFDLIDSIISLSRLTEGQVEEDGDKELVDIRDLVEDRLKTRDPDLDSKDIQVSLDFPEDSQIYIQARPLEEIVSNLIDNAISYNVQGGSIEISLDKGDDCLVLTVADTGIGIPYDQQDHIFERFYMVDKSRSYNKKSTGLGLSIVKHNVDRLGGRVDLVSQEGQGSSFIVSLPWG